MVVVSVGALLDFGNGVKLHTRNIQNPTANNVRCPSTDPGIIVPGRQRNGGKKMSIYFQ